ncbi:hypothetical protein Gohar_027838, partial [Gossypium harknessii]|nr:hypothetical protein [Gossypium harknessii]
MGVVAATIFTSLNRCPLYIPPGDEFGWRQNISLPLQGIEALHKLDLWRKIDGDWWEFHKKYIDIWDRRNDFIPMHEPFFAQKMVTSLEYMPWFRHHVKPYLLLVEARSRKIHLKRPRRPPWNTRFGPRDATGLSSAPTQQGAPMSTPYLGQFPPYFPAPFTNPLYFAQAPHYAPSHHLASIPLP